MTKTLYAITGIVLGGVVAVAINTLAKDTPASSPKPTILLEKKNTLSLRGPVTEDSVAELQAKALEMSHILSPKDTIYLVLDTPGGDVTAGLSLIATLQGLPQKVVTITSFAASMGFITVQNMTGERYILPNGVLMSHRASGGSRGQIPGELNTRVGFWTELIESVEKECASRMNLDVPKYKELIHDEYWTRGDKAVSERAADKVVLARCAQDISGETTVNVSTLFGKVRVVFSNCPLITAPLEISFAGLEGSAYDVERVRRVIYESYTNKEAFARDKDLRENFFSYVH